ncbi:MAG: hypothetical protein ABSE82_12510 [Nitrososphaerales archaeon]
MSKRRKVGDRPSRIALEAAMLAVPRASIWPPKTNSLVTGFDRPIIAVATQSRTFQNLGVWLEKAELTLGDSGPTLAA